MTIETVTSRQNPAVMLACALLEKKERKKTGLFRFDGEKLLGEALDKRIPITTVFLADDRADELLGRFGEKLSAAGDVRILRVSESVFDKISEEKSPEGVLTLSKTLDKIHKIATIYNSENSDVGKDASVSPFCADGTPVLLLDSVRDPGNLGTVLRTAAALGAFRLILSEDCADLYAPRTVRAAMGGLFRQPTVRLSGMTTADAVALLRKEGRRTFAAALTDDSVTPDDVRFEKNDAVVLGNEGHGLSAGTVAACDTAVRIPMTPGSESLNVAAAATVFLWCLR